MQGVEQAWAPDERRRVIRRIVLLNADVRRLERLAQPPEGDHDLGEADRSVRLLRRQLAQDELGAQRAELDRLGAQLDELGREAEPIGEVRRITEGHPESPAWRAPGHSRRRAGADGGARAPLLPSPAVVLAVMGALIALGVASILAFLR